jgi:hypothetical protein
MMPAILKRTAVLWALVLAACTIQLVPSYDQALVDGLDEANTAALTLFASVENGAPKEKVGDYEDRYSEVIGTFEALRQRAQRRQIPPLAARLSKISSIRAFCNAQGDPTACVNTAPTSIGEVLTVIRQMRSTHRDRGLTPGDVVNFRNAYSTPIANALTVENALKR